jgi:peptidoglycan/xylan/chitin deacetylase (PgdA/CDA1 family)
MTARLVAIPQLFILFAVVHLLRPADASPQPSQSDERKMIAVTFDDLPLGGPDVGLARIRAMTAKLLQAIAMHEVPAVGFVNERKLFRMGEVDERIAILRSWTDAGLELGNHTFSHPSLHNTPLLEFQDDVVRGETVTKMLLEEQGKWIRYFRHPFLRTGLSLEVRRGLEQFLVVRGYTVAPVTIENSDWMFALIYANAKARGDSETMTLVADAYLEYTTAQFDFHERVSEEILGYQVRHVLLLHANELNGDFLNTLIALVRDRGYDFISLDEALEDAAYSRPDIYVGPAGVSWIFRWDYADGVSANWREEPVPPQFIRNLYETAPRDN